MGRQLQAQMQAQMQTQTQMQTQAEGGVAKGTRVEGWQPAVQPTTDAQRPWSWPSIWDLGSERSRVCFRGSSARFVPWQRDECWGRRRVCLACGTIAGEL
jgi:hypothetical protein